MSRGVRLLLSVLVAVPMLVTASAITEIPTTYADDATVSGDCDEDEFDDALSTVQTSGGGTIDFGCPDDTTITFTTEKLIDSEVTIDGGDEITFTGTNLNALFEVGSDDHLTLRNLAIENSTTSSGAVYSDGEVTVDDSTFSGNSALDDGNGSGGAIYNDGGTLTVTDSDFSNNSADIFGGAIANLQGTATVTNSTFSTNAAEDLVGGGAIANSDGQLTITDSTFSSNSADEFEGSLGGAIYHAASEDGLVISNSTFTDNSGGDGGAIVILSQAGTTITNSTFEGNEARANGGAIFVYDGSVSVANSTFANNSAATSGGAITGSQGITFNVAASIFVDNGDTCTGTTVSSDGYNLTDDTSCNFSNTDDQEESAADIDLGSLADNGGPTETMLPGSGSVAIDAIPIDDCFTESDQRGVSRHQGFGCDVGAVEVEQDFAAVQTTLCANRYNGDLRMPRTDACASTEVLFQLPDDRPLEVCVNRYNGDARYSRTGTCASTEFSIELLGDGTQPVCVNRYNGDLRVPRGEGQCASTETARTI
ncbi:MAG: choice-of-anchor Q domain-containing protein [Chloroflexota bacterium]